MNNAKVGLFRIAIETRFIIGQTPVSIVNQILSVLAPYGLTVWDCEPKPLEIKHPNITHEHGYVDVHVCENELFGDQPVRDILESLAKIKGVTASVFIDTDSVYAIPSFLHLFTTYDAAVEFIRQSYLNEVIEEYERLARRNLQNRTILNSRR